MTAFAGADNRPIVGPGGTKEDVINAYGWPRGQSQLGPKEILRYPQGSITLQDGRVERVDFSTSVPWPTPRPRPNAEAARKPATPAAAPAAPAAVNPWVTSVPLAMARAAEHNGLILAAFTGSDWSPPSQRFINEVATHPDFVNPHEAGFVLLQVDFANRAAPPPDVRRQHEALRARCGVTTYPAIVMLNAAGEPLATADLSTDTDGAAYREFVIAAVADAVARAEAKRAPPPPVPESPRRPANPVVPPEPTAVGAAMSSAAWHLMVGLAAGAIITGAMIGWLWRKPQQRDAGQKLPREVLTGLTRGSLPSAQQLATWPADRVQLLIASVFEAGGYQVTARKGQANELDLTRPDDPAVRVIACCWAGPSGPAHGKAIRELYGSLVAEGVANGWFVALAGFSDEARELAEQRGITLMDGSDLLSGLRQLPKLALLRAFNRAGA